MLRRALYSSLIVFMSFMILYHVLHTFFVFGLDLMWLQSFAMTKEVFFVVLVICGSIGICITDRRSFLSFLQQYYKLLFVILLTVIYFIGLSWWLGQSVSDIIIGIKYGLRWVMIFAWGLLLAWYLQWVIGVKQLYRLLWRGLMIIIVWWVLWQTGKVIFPSLMQWRGYGPIGDYILGMSPPMRYRTGPGGWMRFSGLFAGPNNLGFLLVACFPIVLGVVFDRVQQHTNTHFQWKLLLVLMIIAIVATLSRAAILMMMCQSIVVFWLFAWLTRKRLFWYIVIWCIVVWWLFYLKPASTALHLQHSMQAIALITSHPWWLWLWTAWPAIHYDGVYLPENQFFQRAIDGWWLGLILVLIMIYMVIYHSKQDVTNKKLLVWHLGFLGLLGMGMFLHSFEDSMANYLFFIWYAFACILHRD